MKGTESYFIDFTAFIIKEVFIWKASLSAQLNDFLEKNFLDEGKKLFSSP